jgi:3-oxoadipate CoA-transferase, beta subunit
MSKGLSRRQMAWRAAQDLADGVYVNLGIGLPQDISNHVPPDREVIYQSENGILGVGPAALPGKEDPGLVDAGGQRVTLVRGAAIFDSADSFAMMRGGHLDFSFLGAFQVSAEGDLANWDALEEFRAPIVGGAMDLVYGAKEVRVLMEHTTKKGEPRIVQRCTYPLTGAKVVRRVYTNLAVLDVTPQGMLAREIAEGLSFADLQARTGATLTLANDCRPLVAPAL